MGRKMISAGLLALFLLLGSAGRQVHAEEQTYRAILCVSSSDWEEQEWGTNAYTEVTGAGSYQITYRGSMDGVSILLIDVLYAGDFICGEDIYLSALSIQLDGQPIQVELSKVITEELFEEGHYRIEIFHPQGNTGDDPPIDPTAIQFSQELTIAFALSSRKTSQSPAPDKNEPVVSTPGATTNAPTIDGMGIHPSEPTDNAQSELVAQGRSRTWILLLIVGLFVMISAFSVAAFMAQRKKE